MKFKKILSITLCGTILLFLNGCTSTAQEAVISPLTLMEKVNTRNIVDGNDEMRIWYDINPDLFSSKDSSQSNIINNIIQDIEFLSDGNLDTTQDLNMSGLLLHDVLLRDQSNAPMEFGAINSNLGSLEDLGTLCEKSNSLNMPVMLGMDFTCISRESGQFIALTELLKNLQAGEDPYEKDPILMDMFYVEQNKEEDPEWINIETTPYYYWAFPQTENPRINLDSHVWRQFIITAIENYFALGVRGFYIEDYENLYPGGASQKDADFMKWFSSITEERKENVINVFSFMNWNDWISEIPAYAADEASSGADGMIAKAVTGAISAKELGTYLESQTTRTQNMCAFLLNNQDGSLDLLKSQARLPQYKMALAITLMLNGQIFITAGDELGLPSSQADLIVQALESTTHDLQEQEGQEIDLLFGNLEEQKKNGDSILNFVQQAILLRNSYKSIAQAPMTLSQEFSTDQVLILDRKFAGSQTVLIFNLSDQEQTVDTSFIMISDLPAELGGVLLTGTEEIKKDGETLKLPPYSMALLK